MDYDPYANCDPLDYLPSPYAAGWRATKKILAKRKAKLVEQLGKIDMPSNVSTSKSVSNSHSILSLVLEEGSS